MTLNNVSAIGSIVDALIICNYDIEIAGHKYKAGEPFTYLKQVTVTIDSQSVSPNTVVATPSKRGLQMVDALNFINRIVISNVPMSEKIKRLFFNTIVDTEMIEWITVTDPVMKLEHANATKPFIFQDGDLMAATDAYIEDGWLHIIDFDETSHYYGCYSYNTTLSTFMVENYPYFKLLLIAKGNVDGKTSDQELLFEKVSLMPQTNFTFAPVTQNNVTLVFGIIEPDTTVKVKI